MTDSSNIFTKHKAGVIKLFILLLAAAVILKILHLVIWERTLYTGTSKRCWNQTEPDWQNDPLAKDSTCNCFVKESNITPVRGKIFDDQGRLLATNFTIFNMTIDGRKLAPVEEIKKKRHRLLSFFLKKELFINDTIYCGNHRNISRKDSVLVKQLIEELSQGFYTRFSKRFPEKDLHYYRKKFSSAILYLQNVEIIASEPKERSRWITSEDTAALAQLPLLRLNYLPKIAPRYKCLNTSSQLVRICPHGEMAKRLLGNYSPFSDDPMSGIEKAFNTELYGSAGSKKMVLVNRAPIPLGGRVLSVDGSDVYTTLNLNIQSIVHNRLNEKLVEEDADWGCVVIMETQTGEVKAYSNLTRVAPNLYRERINYAHNQMVEPGSTFKLASLLAFLERTSNDTEKKYPIIAHNFSYKGQIYRKTDTRNGGGESMAFPIEVFQRSSNVGITSMIFDRYNFNYSAYKAKIDSLYITTSFATQLGQLNAPEFPRTCNNFHAMYNTCFGTAFRMTILQTLVYFNAVANNGKMIAPLFVKEIRDLKGNKTSFQAEVIKEKICRTETIQKARQYLEAVVTGEHGTARKYKNYEVPFAGKTGTRDVWDDATKKYKNTRNSVSFCGYFPTDQPKYTCIVYMHNIPNRSPEAVDLFAKIAKDIYYMANNSINGSVVKKSGGKKIPAFQTIPAEEIAAIAKGLGIGNEIKISQKQTASSAKKEACPDVMGFNAIDATQMLNKAGYKVIIRNRGKVVKQEIDKKNKTVVLILEL